MNQDQPRVRHRPIIRVFVSSTFADLKHERDALQRLVFLPLEQFCAARKFQFQAIDLRWGVPTEASFDHRTMRICLEELRRSQEISPQPNFLILFGNRYGWRPLPEEISESEFRMLEAAASGISRYALEVLQHWYWKDENADPAVFILQRRKTNSPDGEDYTNPLVWARVEQMLWEIVNKAFPPDQLAGRFDPPWAPAAPYAPLPSIARFQTSATEQEIWRGALAARDAREHVIAFFREIDNVNQYKPIQIAGFVNVKDAGDRETGIDPVPQSALARLKLELRARLGDDNVIPSQPVQLVEMEDEHGRALVHEDGPAKGLPKVDVTTGHLAAMCEQILGKLKPIITRQMDDYWQTPDATASSSRESELERLEHERFARERAPASTFVGRESQLNAIAAYVQGGSRQPLVVHGASGSGKTALLARAAELMAGDARPIVRFLGTTPRCADLRSLLASLCQELRQKNPLESPIPSDLNELIREFHAHLGTATADKPIALFLDALDQLSDADNGRSLTWLPFGQLPEHARLVVSCLSDRPEKDPAGEPFVALNRRGIPQGNFIDLDALAEPEARTLLFDRWLPQANRRLTGEQAEMIDAKLKSESCRLPLYLKILFEEAKLWRSYDPLPEHIGGNTTELLGNLFTRLTDPANHGLTVAAALGYIASTRRGLTEIEVLEVLFKDPDYQNHLAALSRITGHQLPGDPPRIPIAIWSRLRYDLSPYLAEQAAPGGTVLNFYHREVGEYVGKRFLASPAERRMRHERLADYFHAQDYWRESLEEQRKRARALPPTPRPANVRKVDELPYQRLQAAIQIDKDDPRSPYWEKVADLLTDWQFLEAKTEAVP